MGFAKTPDILLMLLLEDLSPHFENTNKSTSIQIAEFKCSQSVINYVNIRHSVAEQNSDL